MIWMMWRTVSGRPCLARAAVARVGQRQPQPHRMRAVPPLGPPAAPAPAAAPAAAPTRARAPAAARAR